MERTKILFGLIGENLSHSFSRRHFLDKFREEGLDDHDYRLFELASINSFEQLVAEHQPAGLNVTIPYKESIIPFLDTLDPRAERIGAVNTIEFSKDGMRGHNTDYYGFRDSLIPFVGQTSGLKALVLGTGGSAKAVRAVLEDIGIHFLMVSRTKKPSCATYDEVREQNLLQDYRLVVNTTPVGMTPDTHHAPDINYGQLTDKHFLFDLVYNPEKTLFSEYGAGQGAAIKNGSEMLRIQAEKSWEIWNS